MGGLNRCGERFREMGVWACGCGRIERFSPLDVLAKVRRWFPCRELPLEPFFFLCELDTRRRGFRFRL